MTQTHPTILPDRPGALANYPHARRVGNLIFVSGVSSRRPDNSHEGVTIHADGSVEKDIGRQTQAVIENIGIILEAAGSSLEHVVDMTTFLVNMDDFPGYNAVYNTYFNAKDGPTRTTVAVHQLPHPNLLIEMKAIAVAADGDKGAEG
jgi:2-aminomuconate deaminase